MLQSSNINESEKKSTPRRLVRTRIEAAENEMSAPVEPTSTAPTAPRRAKLSRYLWGISVFIIVAIIAGVLGYGAGGGKIGQPTEAPSKFHAIFLTNGQVYFGTIVGEDAQNIVLSNVFYLQVVNQELPPETEGGTPRTVQQTQLVKKGEEAYGPKNEIRINRSQVTVVEELREDSQVLQDIRARL